MDLLATIGACIVAAAALAFVARSLGQPLLLGYIVAGALLGPHLGFGFIHDEEAVEHVAEIGLILLLFLIGLEISLPRLLQAGKAILTSGLLQFPISAGLAWLALGPVVAATGGPLDRLYFSTAAGLSSTLIVVKLLSDKFELATFGGRVTLGILVFQDLFAIAFLALQPNLGNLDPAILLRSLAGGLVLVAGALVVARHGIPPVFRRIAKSSELIVVSALAWCFLVAGLAGAAGLSREMGALVAGVVLAGLPYGTEIVARIGGVRDFFLTLFFVALGLRVPAPSADLLLLAGALAVLVVATRYVAMVPLFAALRLDTRTAGVVATNLSQVSEFALVIFAIGLGLGHVSAAASSVVLYAVLVTAVLSTYGIVHNHAIGSAISDLLARLGFRRWAGGEGTAPAAGEGVVEPPRDFFLLGASTAGLALVRHLERVAPEVKERIVAVDFSPETLDLLAAHGVHHHYGDISNVETLRHAGIESASLVCSLLSDWILKGTSNADLLRRVRRLAPEARIVVTAESAAKASELYREGADYVLVPPALTAEHLCTILRDPCAETIERERLVQAGDLFER